MKRYQYLLGWTLSLLFLTLPLLAQTATDRNAQRSIDPPRAFQLLNEGNERFRAGTLQAKNPRSAREATAHAQFPYAVVVGCIDSRTSAELLFDQSIGDVFHARLAGNVVSPDVTGSVEFATGMAGARLIVVLGHTECGAVKGACDDVRSGALTGVLERIGTAIRSTPDTLGLRRSSNAAFVREVTEQNVIQGVAELRRSTIIDSLVAGRSVGIIGGIYDIATGSIRWMDETRGGF
jgi:carbonic anhydrase